MPETYTLKQLRGVNGMTQDEVAEKLEVSKFTWVNWESGKTAPDFWQLQKIKILFNVNIDDIKFLPKTSV